MLKLAVLFLLFLSGIANAAKAKYCGIEFEVQNKWKLSPVALKSKIPLPTSYNDLLEVHSQSLLQIGDMLRVKVKNPDLVTRSKRMTYEGAFLGFTGLEKSIVISAGEQVQNYTSTIRTSVITSIEIIAMPTPIRPEDMKEDTFIAYTDDQLVTLPDLRPSQFSGAISVGSLARNHSQDIQVQNLQTKFSNSEIDRDLDDDLIFSYPSKASLAWVKQYSKFLSINDPSVLKANMKGRLMRNYKNRILIIDVVIASVDKNTIGYIEINSDFPVRAVWNANKMPVEEMIGFYLLQEI